MERVDLKGLLATMITYGIRATLLHLLLATLITGVLD
jgi:hypothetical protein